MNTPAQHVPGSSLDSSWAAADSRPDNDSKPFLPDFGSAVVAFRILLVAQCIAIIIVISRNSAFDQAAMQDLLMVSAFVQLIAIGVIIALKAIAAPLQRVSTWTAAAIAFCVFLLVTVAITETIVFLSYQFGLITQRWPEWHNSLLLRALVVTAFISALALRYMFVYHRAQVDSQTKEDDRLQVLHSRIRPHFLFNSMNSVASLIRINPELAERALEDLADVYRIVLADARKMVPITAESQLAREYLDIEKLRLGERLNIKWTVSNVPRSALLPSLTLQPLLENAVYHGIEPSFAGGTITVQLWGEGDMLNIMISNPLPELSASASHRRGNKIAMANVRERLERHFGDRASLQNMEKMGNYFVKIKIPIVRGSAA